MKIAIPNNNIYKQLFFNAEDVAKELGIELIKTSEQQVAKLFHENKVQAAFLSPIGYGMGAGEADYRIVPVNPLALNGYTRAASTFFRQNLATIRTCGCENPDDYIMQIGKILLAERYGIIVDLKKAESTKPKEILENFDSAMTYKKSFLEDSALDITEDWNDSYRMPLVMGAWVVRNEEEPENIERTIELFAADSLPKKKEVTDKQGEFEPRMGEIIYEWSEAIENAYDETLEILFYHQVLPVIASVKKVGDENSSEEPEGNKEEKS